MYSLYHYVHVVHLNIIISYVPKYQDIQLSRSAGEYWTSGLSSFTL